MCNAAPISGASLVMQAQPGDTSFVTTRAPAPARQPKRRRPSLARALVPTFSLLLHAYVAWRLLPYLWERPLAFALDLARHVAPIAHLSSRHGTFFVTGNHEYYSGAESWIAELRRLNVRVLLNEHVVLQHNSEPFIVAGVTDVSGHHFIASHRSDPRTALRDAPSDAAFRLLLAHQPRSAAAAADAGFDLQLSGHTHGGQFLPWNFFVRLQQPFVSGLHRLRGLWVYVSRGTGYWGPPKRFGVPSEITCLRLVRPAA